MQQCIQQIHDIKDQLQAEDTKSKIRQGANPASTDYEEAMTAEGKGRNHSCMTDSDSEDELDNRDLNHSMSRAFAALEPGRVAKRKHKRRYDYIL